MANANGNMNRDGKTVYLRFVKALETCHKKYGDRAKYAIQGVMARQFGPDMTTEALKAIVAKGEYWKLPIQSQRAQHMAAEQNRTAVELLDLLIDGFVAPTKDGTAPTYNHEEAVPF